MKLHSVKPQQKVVFMKLAILCSLSRIQQTFIGTGIGKFRRQTLCKDTNFNSIVQKNTNLRWVRFLSCHCGRVVTADID